MSGLSDASFIVLLTMILIFGGLGFYIVWANKMYYEKGIHQALDKKKKKKERWDYD